MASQPASQPTYHVMHTRAGKNHRNQTEIFINKWVFVGTHKCVLWRLARLSFKIITKLFGFFPFYTIIRMSNVLAVHISFEALKHHIGQTILFHILNFDMLWLLLLSVTSISCRNFMPFDRCSLNTRKTNTGPFHFDRI